MESTFKLPKRIRLLQACRGHLYNEVKQTLATDKEIRSIRYLDSKVERYFNKQAEEKDNG